MKGIRDANTIIGLLEDGDLVADYSKEIAAVLAKLRELGSPKKAVKGSVTLTLSFVVEGVSTEIDAKITSKTPEPERSRSFFFVTDDGLSTEHPRQIQMFPEDADKRRPHSA